MPVTPQTRLIAGSVLLLGVAMLMPRGVTAHHQWGRYHWARATNPLTLDVGNNLGSGWGTYLSTALSDWNQSTVLDLTAVPGDSDPSSCPPTSGRIEVCNYNSGNTGWLGVAQIWTSGRSHIVQATARMNDFYFNQQQYDTPAWRRLVVCQEVAHDFGLDHQDENFNNPNLGTCMDYTSDPDGPPSNEHPNQHDYDQLVSIYSHLDGSSGGGGGGGGRGRGGVPPEIFPLPPQAGGVLSDDPRDWGMLVRANGRLALFDRDLGNGNHVFTFVILA
jgi:hypothetical protein